VAVLMLAVPVRFALLIPTCFRLSAMSVCVCVCECVCVLSVPVGQNAARLLARRLDNVATATACIVCNSTPTCKQSCPAQAHVCHYSSGYHSTVKSSLVCCKLSSMFLPRV
jgi:hypothetical protein